MSALFEIIGRTSSFVKNSFIDVFEMGYRNELQRHKGHPLRYGAKFNTYQKAPNSRDRLLLVNAFAIMLLTLLGAAGESLGMDRLLKSNTVKRRTHSLFRQGCMLYELIPTMIEERLRPLMAAYSELLRQHRGFTETFCVV